MAFRRRQRLWTVHDRRQRRLNLWRHSFCMRQQPIEGAQHRFEQLLQLAGRIDAAPRSVLHGADW